MALAAIFNKIRAEQSELAASDEKPRPKTDLTKLFELIDQERAAKNQVADGAGRGRIDNGGAGSATNVAQAEADAHGATGDHQGHGGPGAATTAGDIWGQIKPCWDRLPEVSTVPIVLVITLDDQGRMAKAPRIIRPGAGLPAERRLISESRALAAVTACGPYRVAGTVASRRVFQVRFDGAGRL